MKKQTLLNLFLFIFFCAVSVAAQRLETEIKIQRPDFSGTWKLNVNKSQGLDKPFGRDADLISLMIIEQKLPSIAITLKLQRGVGADENFFGGKLTLYTDGRGDEYIEGVYPDSSATKWEGNKLIVTHYSKSKTVPEQVSSIQEYELSSDGKRLINTWKRTSFRYIRKENSFREERYFDDSLTLTLIFDRVR